MERKRREGGRDGELAPRGHGGIDTPVHTHAGGDQNGKSAMGYRAY